MMRVEYFSFLFVFILPCVSETLSETFDDGDENVAASNLPFRHELEDVARGFREKLREELSNLEMEMYEEFLKLLQDIDKAQGNLTEKLTEELSRKVVDVMSKFEKVMAYSTERTEVLNDKMKELFSTLAEWAEHGRPSNAHRDRQKTSVKRRRKVRRDNADRSKRHTGLLAPEDELLLRDVSAVKKLLELDPEDFPIMEGMDDMDAFLDRSIDFDGDLEIDDSDFVLREFVPGTKSKFILKSEPSQEQQRNAPSKSVLPRNCYDLLKEGNTQNGVYFIYPSGNGAATEVWCNQESDGGGWTTIVNRRDGSNPPVNFNVTSDLYDNGFGHPSSNHWIGLEVMHMLTQGRSYKLRVILQDGNGNSTFASYGIFRVGSKVENYTLEVEDYDTNSTADDAFSIHSGKPFVYPIPDSGEGCSHNLGVGWWYLEYPLCFQALATGQFQQTGDEETKASAASAGLEWTAWKGNDVSLLSMAFMIRPVSA